MLVQWSVMPRLRTLMTHRSRDGSVRGNIFHILLPLEYTMKVITTLTQAQHASLILPFKDVYGGHELLISWPLTWQHNLYS